MGLWGRLTGAAGNMANEVGDFVSDPVGQTKRLGSRAWDATGGKADDYFFQQPAAEQKAAYGKAGDMSQQNLQQIMSYLGGQQEKAAGYYAPMQQMFNGAYGQTGIDAPQVPQAGGKPLNKMFGG